MKVMIIILCLLFTGTAIAAPKQPQHRKVRCTDVYEICLEKCKTLDTGYKTCDQICNDKWRKCMKLDKKHGKKGKSRRA